MLPKEELNNKSKHAASGNQTKVSFLPVLDISVRKYPYPFQAMLAVCSDLDGTPDGHVYFSMMKYLNTLEDTPLGPGVGLEIGNTIYFDVSSPQFCYWNTSEAGQATARSLIQSGHIDCLHSFGTRATTRAEAARALEELERHNCRLKVWVDHARVPTNFGSDITRGNGDVIGSPAYHADLTTDYGIRHVWRGRVTSIIGQNIQRNFRGIVCGKHPLVSCKTILKEFAKGILPFPKFAMNRSNVLMRETHLRSGQQVSEFMRSSPHWGGVSAGATADGLPEVLTTKTLNWLIKREGCCVLYTHLGRAADPYRPFNRCVKESLSLLSKYASGGQILVTTTRRLLDYCSGLQKIKVSVSLDEECSRIDITKEREDLSLDGMTFYVCDPLRAKLFVDGHEMHGLQRNPPDHTGRPSISLAWRKLEFPYLEKMTHE